jgi:beta-lactamase superfamily II metal-dependent hydrolase
VLQDRPKADELEVSLFGGGVGECVVVHLGDGEWVVVDSCVTKDEPVALWYLRTLGVPLERVRLVVASHWHDDHVRGIADVLAACKNATFALSAAMACEHYVELVRVNEERRVEDSGTSEFACVHRELIQRLGGGRRRSSYAAAVRACGGRRLLRTARLVLWSLSPSDAAVNRSEIAMGEELLRARSDRCCRRLVSTSPNGASVVLWFEAAGVEVLLGADLERGDQPEVGWRAVVAQHHGCKAELVKIPHHGSENADLDGMWTHMLADDPVAILTPFRRVPLPTDTDLQRLQGRATHVHITAPPTAPSLPRRRNAVERTMRGATKSRRALVGGMGHVRVRVPFVGGAPVVTHGGAAYAVR